MGGGTLTSNCFKSSSMLLELLLPTLSFDLIDELFDEIEWPELEAGTLGVVVVMEGGTLWW